MKLRAVPSFRGLSPSVLSAGTLSTGTRYAAPSLNHHLAAGSAIDAVNKQGKGLNILA